jgi:hypothetical protein
MISAAASANWRSLLAARADSIAASKLPALYSIRALASAGGSSAKAGPAQQSTRTAMRIRLERIAGS